MTKTKTTWGSGPRRVRGDEPAEGVVSLLRTLARDAPGDARRTGGGYGVADNREIWEGSIRSPR
jgi:hypothetical protein